MGHATSESEKRRASVGSLVILLGAALCPMLLGCGREASGSLGQTTSVEPAKQSHTLDFVQTEKIPPIFTDETPELNREIVVRNDSKESVHFEHARLSCGCTGTSQLEKMELSSREQTLLRLRLDLRGRTGPQRFICRLFQTGGNIWRYELETTLYPRAHFGEAGAIHFGMVDPDQQVLRDTHFYLHARIEADFPPELTLHVKSDRLRAELGSPVTTQEADGTLTRSYPTRLRLRAPQLCGLATIDFQAEFEQAGRKQAVASSVSWNVRSYYGADPTELYFGSLDPGASEILVREVLVRRLDGQPLQIKSARVSNPCLRASWGVLDSKNNCSIKVVLDPKGMREALWDEITIETDVRAQPLLKIPVAAFLKPAQ